ncbi:non-homologous end joining protein Ku [Nigerium massiliense]|uniref:non-homologous end joining protein Ku n=1 Tax=Nigerium massiliense TaxID=1522317 RepID=UPI0006944866|nr:Ku protein [Nigerium massiliense]
MPRSIWKGAVSFGLVTIPIKLYGATEEKDITFRQVHDEDGGRIRYKRVCEVCGNEIPYEHIAKGYEAGDGRMVTLEASDLEDLPLPSAKSIEIVQFVDMEQIDPAYFSKSYFLEAEGPGVKPYVLLRQALADSGRAGIVKVALRNRESLALVRARDDVLMMHTMLWPDELRDGEFAAPPDTAKASKAELTMATSFIDQLTADFDPTAFEDSYRAALEEVVSAKLEGVAMPEQSDEEAPKEADVVDLVAALKASVEAAKKRRSGSDKGKGGEGTKKSQVG